MIRRINVADNLPANLDGGGARGPGSAAGSYVESHVLLAACSATESAREEDGRGNFTKAFLALLQSEGVDKLTYSDVLTRMDAILGYVLSLKVE
jgi:hypothetical protein